MKNQDVMDVLLMLVKQISPFIGQDEMQARYNVTGKTLLAMERRKEIPTRVRGRWLRSEVIQWEATQNLPISG